MRVTNKKIKILSKSHCTKGPKIPFISNLKKPTCASKQDVLELAILRYSIFILQIYCPIVRSIFSSLGKRKRGQKPGGGNLETLIFQEDMSYDFFRYYYNR